MYRLTLQLHDQGKWHDAIAIAERWPVGMLFVRCKGGVSHHPAESVNVDDVALAIDAFSRADAALDKNA